MLVQQKFQIWRLFCGVAALIFVTLILSCGGPDQTTHFSDPSDEEEKPTFRIRLNGIEKDRVVLWWDHIPNDVEDALLKTGDTSNINRENYAGPESCKGCHEKNYQTWSEHPHRWMNALANEESIKGDFSGDANINYLGGVATFFMKDEVPRMRLERDETVREYEITQTIGSRFFQYYVGKLIEGPEPLDHYFRQEENVLPFGYWLDEKEWVPVVHVVEESPDGKRRDPFDPPTGDGPESLNSFYHYARACNYCHTTFSLGDMMVRNAGLMSKHTPAPLHMRFWPYLTETHGEDYKASDVKDAPTGEYLNNLLLDTMHWDAQEHAVTLGVSCEACHLGCQEHVANPKSTPPKFFPSSPLLFADDRENKVTFDRSHNNVNWACGRCHAGERPYYAGGMSTWNSTEYSDAMRGSCYSEMRCVDCHNPHEKIGTKWPHTPQHNDSLCLKCHEKFEPAAARVEHTHHPMDSEGSRCMNCHMPRINEGMQDMVRTHTIFSPTQRDMIEAGHPNACNLCHAKEPINWTLGHLKEWYDKEYAADEIAKAYVPREKSVAAVWATSDNEAVRLVGSDVLCRTKSKWGLAELIDMLDDPYLINRQFTSRRMSRAFDIDLKKYGYRFYMTPKERAPILETLRDELLGDEDEK